jgi:histidine triad (HIT) family protein
MLHDRATQSARVHAPKKSYDRLDGPRWRAMTIQGTVMAYDSNNIFAKILRGEIPAVKVYEDDKTLAFMDVMPQADGHTLVIPKEAAADVFDLSPAGAAALMATTQRIAKAVKKGLNAPGLMIAQLNGSPAGQSVFHVHFHIIPKSGGADFKLHAREMERPEKLKAMAEKIKAALE